jgi:hypothetical protein
MSVYRHMTVCLRTRPYNCGSTAVQRVIHTVLHSMTNDLHCLNRYVLPSRPRLTYNKHVQWLKLEFETSGVETDGLAHVYNYSELNKYN